MKNSSNEQPLTITKNNRNKKSSSATRANNSITTCFAKNEPKITNNQDDNNSESSLDPQLFKITNLHPDREMSGLEVSKLTRLIITEEKGDLFPIDKKKLEMNPQGLIEVKGRGKRDGIVIFSANESFSPDIKINLQNYPEFVEYIYIFAIYYDKESTQYYIRAHPDFQRRTNNLRIKIYDKKSIYFHQAEALRLSDSSYIQIETDETKLRATLVRTNMTEPQVRQFTIEESPITIGRSSKCSIPFINNSSFSRIQCTITYDEAEKEWKLIDGCEEKNSTNGTWVVANHSFEIENELIFKVLDSTIKISVVNAT